MIAVGIDVAKDKHDCLVIGGGGEILADSFVIPNSQEGFLQLLGRIGECAEGCERGREEVRVGLEATGHYGTNLLAFLVMPASPSTCSTPSPPTSTARA